MEKNIIGKYFTDTQVDRILLEDDQWIDIKKKLSIADQDALKCRLMEIDIDTSALPEGLNRSERRRQARAGGTKLNAKYRPSTAALLEIGIVDWSFVDEDNNKLPVTPEWIGRLSPEWAYKIEDELEARNTPLAQPATPQ